MFDSQPDTPTSKNLHPKKPGRSRESTMLVQGILVWLMLAIAVVTLWMTFTALGYLMQTPDVSLLYRVIRSSVIATILIIGGLFFLRKIYRGDSLSRSQSKLK